MLIDSTEYLNVGFKSLVAKRHAGCLKGIGLLLGKKLHTQAVCKLQLAVNM